MPTESFFSQSSLAYIASAGAGKDGKAYSIKPADGTGDFTFSRGSNLAATRVGADGLIEKGRENLILQSNSFNSAPWSTSSSDATTGQSGYDGTNDAWLLSKTAINGRVQQNIVTSGVQTFSVYAKAGTKNWTNLLINGGPSVFFDLQNGVLGSASNYIDANIESVGNGFYRCSVTFNATISRVRIYVSDDNNNNTGTSGNIIIQDAQLEVGLTSTEYIESGATKGKAGLLESEPRFDYSNGASCPSLLLEPSRTQLFGNTEYFENESISSGCVLDTNADISPEGLKNATSIYGNGNSSAVFFGETIILPSSGTYIWSLFAKAGGKNWLRLRNVGFDTAANKEGFFNIANGTKGVNNNWDDSDIEDYGNGWYRIWVKFTATTDLNGAPYIYLSNSDGDSSITDFGSSNNALLFGNQMEAGSYISSYIPNNSGGTETRAVDACSKTGISSLIGQTEGVLYWKGENIGDDFAPYLGLFADAPNANSTRVMVYYLSQTTIQVQVRLSGVVQFLSAAATVSGKTKVAIGYRENDFVLYVNGVKISESSSGSTFTNQLTTFNFNSAICKSEQILIFKTRLSNADLATLTTI